MQSMNLSKVWDKLSCTSYDVQFFAKITFSSHFFSKMLLDVNYAVKEVTEGAEYEFRVSAINESGAGDPSPPSAMVCAKNPNSEYRLRLCISMTCPKLIFHLTFCLFSPSETLFQRPRRLHCCQSRKLCTSQNLL